MTQTLQYSYGHTAEASKLVRETLKKELAAEIKKYGLAIQVLRADSGYGGPRVRIRTDNPNFNDYYEYIVDENGQPSNSGKLVRVTTQEFGSSSVPVHMAQLKRARQYNEIAKQVEAKIQSILNRFGKDNDDAMTDYFDNTMPLYYGINH